MPIAWIILMIVLLIVSVINMILWTVFGNAWNLLVAAVAALIYAVLMSRTKP